MHSGAMAPRFRLGHRPGLDALRGVAILLVLASHLWSAVGWAGYVGVTLFFGLSGFLITALLLEESARDGEPSMRRFYLRRARRLLPAMVPVLIVASIIELGVGWDPTGDLVIVAGYATNLAVAAGRPMLLLQHFWSLAVEEQFYFVWPALVALAAARRLPARRLALWSLVGAGISFGSAVAGWLLGASPMFLATSTLTRADSLLVGCALAAGLHADWRPRVPVVLLGAAAGAVVAACALEGAPGALTVPAAATLATVPALVATLRAPGLLSRPILRWVGRRSYALYLWHYPLVLPSVEGWWPLPVWAAVVLAFAAAELSWWLVERPFMRSEGRAQQGPRLQVLEVGDDAEAVEPDERSGVGPQV